LSQLWLTIGTLSNASTPFRVLSSDRFVQACLAEISDDWLSDEPLVGSADQFADSTDVTSSAVTVRRLRHVYS